MISFLHYSGVSCLKFSKQYSFYLELVLRIRFLSWLCGSLEIQFLMFQCVPQISDAPEAKGLLKNECKTLFMGVTFRL